jgi:hypothetical protein
MHTNKMAGGRWPFIASPGFPVPKARRCAMGD